MSTVPLAAHASSWLPFLDYLPLVRATASRSFSSLAPDARDEAVEDVVADAAAGYARLAARGRPHFWLIPALTRFAIQKRIAGRRMGTATNKRDVLSPVPRRTARVKQLSAEDSKTWQSVLVDRRGADPAELAAIRLDFQEWLERLPERQRELALSLAVGERPGELARRLSVSPGRISQLRAELRAAWDAFQSDRNAIPAAA